MGKATTARLVPGQHQQTGGAHPETQCFVCEVAEDQLSKGQAEVRHLKKRSSPRSEEVKKCMVPAKGE